MTDVPPKIGSERVGMMKSSRLAVVIASPIRGKSAMSLVSGKSVGMSVIRTVTGLSASVDGAAVIHVANASGRPVAKCKTRREYAYRTVNTGDTSCNDQWSVWGLISSGWNWILEVLGFSNPGPWCLR